MPAAQLLDSNVDLPGGFLDLFNKPVRESSCECERGTGLNLGPILAMVNGPIVADAIKDPNNRLNKFVLSEKDDGKAADEIYLAVLNRLPTATERTAAIAAIRAAAADHAAMIAEYKPKADAFDAYKKTLDVKQQAWEDGLKGQKPTVWLPVDVRRADPKTPDTVLKLNRDGSVLATGKAPETELYTIYGLTETDRPITAIRLEALADSSLPVKGPGPHRQRQLRAERVPPHLQSARQAGRDSGGDQAHLAGPDLRAGHVPGGERGGRQPRDRVGHGAAIRTGQRGAVQV